MANSADTTFSLISEATSGLTPATPAFLTLDVMPGATLDVESDMLTSPMNTATRAVAGVQKVADRVVGSFETQLKRDAAIDEVLESGLSGTWTANVLTGSNIDSSMTLERKFLEGTSKLYSRFNGVQSNKITISSSPKDIVKLSSGLIGMASPIPTTAIITGATYAASANTQLLTGADVSITISGLSVDYSSFELNVEHTRAARHAFGSRNAKGITTDGNRKVTLSLVFYRIPSDAVETLFNSNTPASVTVTMGAGANGYSFTLPAAVSQNPKGSQGEGSELVTLELTAQRDANGVDIRFNKLA